MDSYTLAMAGAYLLTLWVALTLHEYGHAAAGWLLGDDTAARHGRLTLNPLAHLDPVGSVLIPIVQILAVSKLGVPVPLFGYARPVPFQAHKFTRKVTIRGGSALVALAGPGMNLAQALVGTLALMALFVFRPDLEMHSAATLLMMFVTVNIGLACFNLIPVPPLDGGWVLGYLLPTRLDRWLEVVGRYGVYMLIGAMVLPSYLGVSRVTAGNVALGVAIVAWVAQPRGRRGGAAQGVLEIAGPLALVLLGYEGAKRLMDVLGRWVMVLVSSVVA
jgi:Zn-dependent protease